MGARPATSTGAAPRTASRPRLRMLVKTLAFRAATPGPDAAATISDLAVIPLATTPTGATVDLPRASAVHSIHHLAHQQSDGSFKPSEFDAHPPPAQSPIEFTVLPIAPKAFVRRRKSISGVSNTSIPAPTAQFPSSSPSSTSSPVVAATCKLSRRASSPAAGAPTLVRTSRSLSERKSVNSLESDDSSGSGGGGIYGWNAEEAEEANRAYVEFMRKKTGRDLL